MKTCTKCNTPKQNDEFYTKSDRDSASSMCKPCFNQYCIDRWKQAKIDAVIYKGSKCVDCNLSYPSEPSCIFDFHHLDPAIKEFAWNKIRLVSTKRRQAELDKCILLCANCHRKRHSN